jgi:hypothetical protein
MIGIINPKQLILIKLTNQSFPNVFTLVCFVKEKNKKKTICEPIKLWKVIGKGGYEPVFQAFDNNFIL